MLDMGARWKAKESQKYNDLESRMEANFKAMFGAHTGNTGATSVVDDRHLTEVFLSKLSLNIRDP